MIEPQPYGTAKRSGSTALGMNGPCVQARAVWLIREPDEGYKPAAKPRLLDQLRQAIRARHYSYRTEEAYVGWVRRYVLFHQKRHPMEMGKAEITQFLTSLAVDRKVAASTQNQALAALLLYQDVLGHDPGWLDDVVRAKRLAATAGGPDAR